jgi:hypothetical protein
MQKPAFSLGVGDNRPDTIEDFKRNLIAIHQPFDLISVHIYPADTRFGRPVGRQDELVTDAAAAAASVHKPLFVGEFGDDKGLTPFMRSMARTMAQDQVAYSAVWVWELYQTAVYRTRDTAASLYSVEPGYSDDLIRFLGSMAKTSRNGPELPFVAGAREKVRVIIAWPLPCSLVDMPKDLVAVASDGAQKVNRVEFMANGKVLGAASVPPYSARFDPTGLGDGTVELVARAVGESGAFAEFKSVVRLNRGTGSCAVQRQ